MKWLLFFIAPVFLSSAQVSFPWVIYYGDKASSEQFTPYNPIVFDAEHHPSLRPLVEQGKELLGYVNLCEVSLSQDVFIGFKKQGLLIEENSNWKGSWSVDIRADNWKKFILDDLIPKVLSEGFTGIFLDQIDIAIDLEKKNPSKYKGMKQAAVDLIKEIKKRFPNRRIMMNRGYDILPMVGNQIDYELAETLYSSYDFVKKCYFIRPENELHWQLEKIDAARALCPHLVVFSVDYANPSDPSVLKQIYQKLRSYCIRPYVTTVWFDEITAEPSQ